MMITLPSDRRFLPIRDLLASGITYYGISSLVDQGRLKKINKRMYENLSYSGDESDFDVACAYVPRGVLCMMTAARFHGLTTYLPDCVDIAIGRSMKVSTLPETPTLKIWYFPKTRYEAGVTTVCDEVGSYRMYDVEKTVVDILYYRNKMGIEETKEILTNYLGRERRDLVKLRRYANGLGCERILSTYLEVLL